MAINLHKKIKLVSLIFVVSILCFSLASFNDTINVSATPFNPSPPPPNQGFSWNFTKGDLLGYKTEIYINNLKVNPLPYTIQRYIYNITDIGYSPFDVIGLSNYYYVEMDILYYNANTSTFNILPNTGMNYSLVSLTNEEMFSSQFSSPGVGLAAAAMPNYFVPFNGTELALEWCANALNKTIFGYFYENMEINLNTNEIKYYNETTSDYNSLKYFDNGTLDTWIYFYEDAQFETYSNVNITYKISRIFDFNPVDGVEWGVEKDDTLIYEMDVGIIKFKIVDFLESSYISIFPPSFPIAVSEVRADIWILNDSREWDLVYKNYTIALADENSPDLSPYVGTMGSAIYPINLESTAIHQYIQSQYSLFSEFSIVGADNAVKILNQTSGGYLLQDWADDGVITYRYGENINIESYNMTLLCRNPDQFNASIENNYDYITLDNVGENNNYDVGAAITATGSSLWVYSGSKENPTYAKLNDALLFFQIDFYNEVINLNILEVWIWGISTELYDDVEIWWFNQSANDGFGKWETIEFTDLGGGQIEFYITHLSVFALTGKPDTTPPNVVIDFPTNSTYTTDGLYVSLSGNALNYWYYIEGMDNSNQTYTGGIIRWGFLDGTYTLYAYGNDTAGNIGEANVTFTIDTTPPNVFIVSPITKTYATNTITISLGGDALNYWYYIQYIDSPHRIWTDDEDRTLSDGDYTLFAYGSDIAGNMAAEVNITFTIDTTPPSMQIEGPGNATIYTSNITVSLWGEEYVSPPIQYWYYIEGVDSSNRTWTGPETRILDDGMYTLHAYCSDAVGNTIEKSVTFTIDTTPEGERLPPQIPFGSFYLIYVILMVGIEVIYITQKKLKSKI
jgi:hypothetical protein